MSAPMVRAILEGRKTQTRRVMKLQPDATWARDEDTGLHYALKMPASAKGLPWWNIGGLSGGKECPYGKIGDRLWVRETHLPKASGTIYRADFSEFEAAGFGGMYGGWKPSIFCKREHSRITLEIIDVRAERLQDISEGDAIAEGIEVDGCGHAIRENDPVAWGGAKSAYAELWESINGAGSFDANPWVWVIEFKRVKP